MRKLFSLFAALTLSVGLWAQNNVLEYEATQKLEDINEGAFAAGPLQEHTFDDGKGKLVFMNNIANIGMSAFQGNRDLTAITIPASVWQIENEAFSGCSNLTTVYVSWTEAPQIEVSQVFSDISYEPTLHVPFGTSSNYSSWMTIFTIEESSPKVGDILINSDIKYEVTAIGDVNTVKVADNSYNNSLQSVAIPEQISAGSLEFNVTEMNSSAFAHCTGLSSITIPTTIKTLSANAFADCNNLSTVNLPNTLETISTTVFSSCTRLQTISIPASVTSIGDYAFLACQGLKDVYVPWSEEDKIPTISATTFDNIAPATPTLHIPDNTKEYYIAKGWTVFFQLEVAKTAAIAAVNAEIDETDNDNVKAIATSAATAINAATTIAEINALKTLAIAAITSAKAAYTEGETAGYNTGYDEGEAAVRAELPTEGYDGPAVIITKGEKVLTLFNPEKVEYQIQVAY